MEHHAGTAPAPQSPLTPLVRAIEEAGGLDPLVRVGDAVSGAVAGSRPVRHLLQGRGAGHALHPVVVQAPLGMWTSAAALDVVGGAGAGDAARRLTGLGVLAAVPAALTGWAEYADTRHRDRRTGVVHAATNGVGVLLQAGSWWARRADRPVLGTVLGLSGLSVSGAAGYLGGHLAVARKVGSRDAAWVEPVNGSVDG